MGTFPGANPVHSTGMSHPSFSESALLGWEDLETPYVQRAYELLDSVCQGGCTDTDAIVITETEAPYTILYVNAAWRALCGFSELEADGNTMHLLHGPLTDTSMARRMMKAVAESGNAGSYLVNYRGDGSSFLNEVQIARDTEGLFLAAKLREVSTFAIARCIKLVNHRYRTATQHEEKSLKLKDRGLTDRQLLESTLGKRKLRFYADVGEEVR